MSHKNHQRHSSGNLTRISSNNQNPLLSSFASLDNFMQVSKRMQEEIMVPSKLKDKQIKIPSSSCEETEHVFSDVYNHYQFIGLIRNQLMKPKPFINLDEDHHDYAIKNKEFKKTFDDLAFHYREMMLILDKLSKDANSITELYNSNI